jgi:murein DD-endopeptidase MepM/ murein hydrolase activator NlpD
MTPGFLDTFGLRPLGPALAALRRAAAGTRHQPRNEWGLSSLHIFKPHISIPTWLGRRRADHRVPIYNLFNRVPGPPGAGYSTRVTFARDFRGGRWTYDGHLGTDFACPVGTPLVAAAPGRVVRVHKDLSMGGLKLCIDHGDGLLTTMNHLARELVSVGDRVARGQVVAWSGASGWEFVLFFPWVAPHLHFNTWLDGEPVDPFAAAGETPLWRGGNEPVPHAGAEEAGRAATDWDPALVDDAARACRDPAERRRLLAITDVAARAAEVMLLRNYRAALFEARPPLYRERHERRPRLDLPFRGADFVGVALPRSGAEGAGDEARRTVALDR